MRRVWHCRHSLFVDLLAAFSVGNDWFTDTKHAYQVRRHIANCVSIGLYAVSAIVSDKRLQLYGRVE